MATVEIQVPPSNYRVPGSHPLTQVSYPKTIDEPPSDAARVATDWVASFNSLLQSESPQSNKLFLQESYWRDLLCLTWDFHTLHGPEKISSQIKSQKKGCWIKSVGIDKSSQVRKPRLAPVDFAGNVNGIQSFLTVDTDVGRGRGVVRLLPDPEDSRRWKAFTLFTSLEELKGYEEVNGERRPTGTDRKTEPGRKNWKQRRTAEENFEGGLEPAVLIVGKYALSRSRAVNVANVNKLEGAGQGGLTVAARLKQLNVKALIVDQKPRIGDNWRNRYHQLVLHDPVW